MKKSYTTYRGMRFEIMECPKCHEKVFTEEQAFMVAAKFEAKRLEDEYKKNLIKIGHSFGITFPKAVVEVFGLKAKKSVKMIPHLDKGVIEIRV